MSGFYGNGYTCYPESAGETTSEEPSSTLPAQCRNGEYYDDSQQTCVDIDECTQYANICGRDPEIECINRLEGYDCRCRAGFYRRGSNCYPESEIASTTQESSTSLPSQCRNGYYYEESQQSCVDIDECVQYPTICGKNGECINLEGSYQCACRRGFYRRGPNCYPESDDSTETTEEIETSTRDDDSEAFDNNNSGIPPNHWLCDQCSENADCTNGICKCHDGWTGNGNICEYKCPEYSVWENDRCVPTSEEEECKLTHLKENISKF